MPWHRCDVLRTGAAENRVVYVMLRDTGGAFPGRWFKAVDQMKREMLATALAAMSTGRLVDALVPSTVEYSDLNRLYIVREYLEARARA